MMELQWGWPLVTTALMFISYSIGKYTGFSNGENVGFVYGCEQGSEATAKVLIEYMRAEHDLDIDDATALTIINSINIATEGLIEDE